MMLVTFKLKVKRNDTDCQRSEIILPMVHCAVDARTWFEVFMPKAIILTIDKS